MTKLIIIDFQLFVCDQSVGLSEQVSRTSELSGSHPASHPSLTQGWPAAGLNQHWRQTLLYNVVQVQLCFKLLIVSKLLALDVGMRSSDSLEPVKIHKGIRNFNHLKTQFFHRGTLYFFFYKKQNHWRNIWQNPPQQNPKNQRLIVLFW